MFAAEYHVLTFGSGSWWPDGAVHAHAEFPSTKVRDEYNTAGQHSLLMLPSHSISTNMAGEAPKSKDFEDKKESISSAASEIEKVSTPTKNDTRKQTPKESYEDYISSLPPPFWAQKQPPSFSETASTAPSTRPSQPSADRVAANINAVCAPITAADRAEDERRKNRTMRERWKDWKSKEEKRKSEADLRPMESGSSARLRVWGTVVTDKKSKK
jgi:hypothetical protein